MKAEAGRGWDPSNHHGHSAGDVAWAASPPPRLAEWAAGMRRQLEAAGPDEMETILVARTVELLTDHDVVGTGVPRHGRHADSTWWLYYDQQLHVIVGRMNQGEVIQAHNHGNWNVTGVLRGALKYIAYERVDDRSTRYHADLRIRAEPILRSGEAILCPPPPDDIHEIVCLEDDTVTVLVAPPFADIREYYLPDKKVYLPRSGDPSTAGVPAPKGD